MTKHVGSQVFRFEHLRSRIVGHLQSSLSNMTACPPEQLDIGEAFSLAALFADVEQRGGRPSVDPVRSTD